VTASGPHELQALAHRRWPLGRHPGGLGWELARGELPPTLAIQRRPDGTVAGWAGIDQPGAVAVEADADVAADLLALAVDAATGEVVEVAVAAGDHGLRAAVEAAGFTMGDPWSGMWRRASVDDRPHDLADGCVVRATREGEEEARVDVHRRAWRPADLPWHPDHRPPIAPGAESSFDCDRFAAVQATWLYDADLDLVVERPDGALVACCTAWFDAVLGVAEIEPLGVVPEFRRRGLAGAMCLEVSARVAERGGDEVFISVGPSVAYPANHGAYTKAGYETRRRGDVWRLRR
jgi:ribosomal protein S18 acetylase RimI-like enzyme